MLAHRQQKIIVVAAKNAEQFAPFGRAIMEAAGEHRKPLFVMIYEGQLFSGYRASSAVFHDPTFATW